MEKKVEMITEIRSVMKLYDLLTQKICQECRITRGELDILGFLNNHPGKDTAKDIVEIRMFPKANVSQAVELLIQKGYLCRNIDERDRRKIHLSITDEAAEIVKRIYNMQSQYEKMLFQGFSKEEEMQYEKMVFAIYENARKEIERIK